MRDPYYSPQPQRTVLALQTKGEKLQNDIDDRNPDVREIDKGPPVDTSELS